MKIATWNVNGIRARAEQVRAWVEQERPHVVCLQEIKATPEQVPEALRDLPDYWCYWHGAKAYSGVALLIARQICPEEPAFAHPPFDMENRMVAAQINGVVICSVYVPNGGKDFPTKLRFLEALEAYMKGFAARKTPLLIAGDLNIAHTDRDVHPKERREVIGQLPVEREQFDRLLQGGVVDVGRALDPGNEELFTWWAPWRQMRQRNIGWRLDYLLATETLAKTATACSVQREIGTSDHAPVLATFELGKP